MLTEIMDLAPINLKPIGDIDGMSIYSNDKIQTHIKDWLTHSPTTKKVHKKLIEGIESKIILIGYENPSKSNFIKTRWRDFREKDLAKGYLGYTSVAESKIAIVFDENINMLGNAVKDIPHTVVHECLHLVALTMWKPYLMASMNKFLIPFFTSVFEQLDPKINKIPNRKLSEAIINVSRITDHNFHNRPDVNAVFGAWVNYLKLAPGVNASDIIVKAFAPYYKYGLKTLKPEFNKVAKEMVIVYNNAYKSIKVKDAIKQTLPCQEIFFPSEVVCIANQYKPSSTAVKLLNGLRF